MELHLSVDDADGLVKGRSMERLSRDAGEVKERGRREERRPMEETRR